MYRDDRTGTSSSWFTSLFGSFVFVVVFLVGFGESFVTRVWAHNFTRNLLDFPYQVFKFVYFILKTFKRYFFPKFS